MNSWRMLTIALLGFSLAMCGSAALHSAPAEEQDPSAEAELKRLREENARLKEQINRLVAQVARLKHILNRYPEPPDVPLTPLPPNLSGVVTAVKMESAEISIGSDDGLAVGHELKIVRDKMASGRVVVRRVDPDRAVVELTKKDDVVKVGDQVVPIASDPK